ncbi:MAG: hypothetical protein ACXV6K_10660, partial [Halobacteriota archaeon]
KTLRGIKARHNVKSRTVTKQDIEQVLARRLRGVCIKGLMRLLPRSAVAPTPFNFIFPSKKGKQYKRGRGYLMCFIGERKVTDGSS